MRSHPSHTDRQCCRTELAHGLAMQDWWRNGEGSAASMDGEDLSAAFALRFIVKTQVTSSVLHPSPPPPIFPQIF